MLGSQNFLAIQQWSNPILFIYLFVGGGGYEWGGDGLGSWFWRVSVHPSGVVEFGDSCQLKHIVRVLIGGSQVPAHSVPQIPPTLCFKL